MKIRSGAALCGLTAFASLAHAASYTYVGQPYSTEIAFLKTYTAPCTAGACANYTPDMRVTGALTTANPLPSNRTNMDITALITGYSFSDGIHTYASTDPQTAGVRPFMASTDAGGNIIALATVLGRWQTPAPHANGSRLDYMELGGYNAGLNLHYDMGNTNAVCTAYTAAGDTCTNATTDSNSSLGASSPLGAWSSAVAVVEYYNPDLDNYFITADPNEQAFVDTGGVGRWQRTGNAFRAGGTGPVCRFYGNGNINPATGAIYGPNSHFYTADPAECAGLKTQYVANAKSWKFESNDFLITPATNAACPPGLAPVYRAYNNGFARNIDSDHRITSNAASIQAVVVRGWADEGIVMCAPQ